MEFVGNWLRHDGRYSIVMNNIGNAYLGLGDSESAYDAFVESIEMPPPNTPYQSPHDGLKSLGVDYSDD
jgi:hypothetical protein